MKRKCTYDSHPTWYGQLWHFLWHEDTWLSFLADAALIVLIGYFILYPGVGLLLGTEYPAVVVVSDSMDHQNKDFEDWWDGRENRYAAVNISESDFKEYSFKNGFNKGDILVVTGQDEYEVGDVIVYYTPSRQYPIIHRVVAKDGNKYQTLGDANSGQLSFEKSISIDAIYGRASFKIPYLGWLKVGLVEIFN
tara:strand:+ start:92 stop:670 length:579 start_codon:yes stop_codon:yes gene_type:complete